MARLVVKKAPWWASHKKQVLVWLPVASLQASTLAGLGYVYHRLSGLEEQQASEAIAVAAVNDQPEVPMQSSAPIEYTLSVFPQTARLSLPKPEPLALQLALASPQTVGMMRVGQDFSSSHQATTTRVKASPRRHEVVKPVSHKSVAKKLVVKPVVKKDALSRAPAPKPVALVMPESVPAQVEEPVAVSLFQPNAGTVPVGASVWVYLGELRDYGWYGQKLHVAPDSGLPEVGRSYRTQKIHGFYDAPHGNRSMGGFQQGDKVIVQQVIHEGNGDVWAQLFKEVAVGRIN